VLLSNLTPYTFFFIEERELLKFLNTGKLKKEKYFQDTGIRLLCCKSSIHIILFLDLKFWDMVDFWNFETWFLREYV
jgi:hypothetical protein